MDNKLKEITCIITTCDNAGKECEDEEVKEALKECGLGTPATRAGIIETLFDRGYIIRHKKTLIPTKKGMELYGIIKTMRMADAELTGSWEQALLKIEKEPDYYTSFIGGINIYTQQVVSEVISVAQSQNYMIDTQCICPQCRLGKVVVLKKMARCNYSKCHFSIYRDIAGKTLSQEDITDLLKKGETPLIKGFVSKKGKTFDAHVCMDKENNTKFRFPPKK